MHWLTSIGNLSIRASRSVASKSPQKPPSLIPILSVSSSVCKPTTALYDRPTSPSTAPSLPQPSYVWLQLLARTSLIWPCVSHCVVVRAVVAIRMSFIMQITDTTISRLMRTLFPCFRRPSSPRRHSKIPRFYPTRTCNRTLESSMCLTMSQPRPIMDLQTWIK